MHCGSGSSADGQGCSLATRQVAALRPKLQSHLDAWRVLTIVDGALAIAVEVQPETSRLVVASRCWTLCYRCADTLLPLD